MDPFSHIAFGSTLAALHTPRVRLRGTIVAVVLGTLAPDADAVLMPVGWDIYLRAHETGTHSLLGSLGIAALTALVVRRAVRESRYWPLVAAAWVGALSHLTLDLLSGARVQLGWPWTDARLSVPLVAMAEPALIAIFLAGSIALLVLRKSSPQRRHLTAIAVLAVTCLFLGLKAVLLSRALSSLHGQFEPSVNRIVEARWAHQTEWFVYDRTADGLQQWLVRIGGAPVLLLSWPEVPEPPLVTRSRSLSTVRNFLHVHQLAFAVQRPDPTGGNEVLWSDIRFCWKPDGLSAATPPLSALTTGTAGIACALWFGGTFDESGRVVKQRVQVGGWNQTRAP